MSETKQTPTPSIDPLLIHRLEQIAAHDTQSGIKQKFAEDSNRVNNMSHTVCDLHFDLSKTHISNQLIDVYCDLAKQSNFVQKRRSLFAGESINVTEGRAVLHTLLRDPNNQGIEVCQPKATQQALSANQELLDQYQAIQAKLATRSTPIVDIIHVGIGGSSLGPQLVTEALTNVDTQVKVHFLDNIDAHQLISVLAGCSVQSTLVIGVSKTFTTAETLQNLDSIAQWFSNQEIANPIDHFYAVTSIPENACAYGIPEQNVVSFPEWVGGRYSVWSSVSLSAALVFGMEKFQEFLAGAARMDQHFYHSPAKQNICFLTAMLDHYYCNFLGAGSKAIFAYDYRLRSLTDYLQQLETESNGKDRQIDGTPVDQKTSPVVWGGVGTQVQHSVFQMLHQGTSLIPSEFLLIQRPDHHYVNHHLELLANGLAQTAALLAGQNLEEVNHLKGNEELSELAKEAKIFAGDKPSTTILLEQLDAKALGSLLAFYEHRTFCCGVLANINSFDQMGVELGKRLATELKSRLSPARSRSATSNDDFDPSTSALIERVRESLK